ncbi:MAG: hypothetical protein AB7O32_18280, partial [Vicinamibacterales bacterium]
MHAIPARARSARPGGSASLAPERRVQPLKTGSVPSTPASERIAQLQRALNGGPRAGQLGGLSRALQAPGGAAGPPVVQRVGGQTTGYDPDAIAKPAFKEDVKRLFAVARGINKLRKQVITKQNNDALGGLATDKEKGAQVKNVYALALTTVNLDVDWLTTVLTDDAKVAAALQGAKTLGFVDDPGIAAILQTVAELRTRLQIADGHILDLTWKVADGGEQPKARILVGADAFAPSAQADPTRGIHRPTFKKLGKDGQEYVKDDLGTYTRRYAYMEKSYHQVMAYKETGLLTGKTQDMLGAATGTNPALVNPLAFGDQHLTGPERALVQGQGPDADAPKRTLAYAHQWKGSGPGQRGLSLASTPKDEAVYGNAGDSFRSADGAKFTVDLAKVNPANNLLINHYSASSPTRTHLGGDASQFDRRLGGHYQYERSVIKNREIYLQQVTTEATLRANQMGLDFDVASQSFTRHRLGAQRAQLLALKAEFEAALQRARLDKPTAETARDQAQTASAAATRERDRYRGKFKATVPLGPGGARVNAFRHWDGVARAEAAKAETARQQVAECDSAIARLPGDIVACDRQLATLLGALPLAAGPGDTHASSGWSSGTSWAEGFKAGLAAKARGKSRAEKVGALFGTAYDPANKSKYAPYW